MNTVTHKPENKATYMYLKYGKEEELRCTYIEGKFNMWNFSG